MTKILVTGGAGFIGSNLADMLLERDFEVSVLDNLSSGKKSNLSNKVDFIKGDICNSGPSVSFCFYERSYFRYTRECKGNCDFIRRS